MKQSENPTNPTENPINTLSNGTITVNSREYMKLVDNSDYALECINKSRLLIEEIYNEYLAAGPEADVKEAKKIMTDLTMEFLDLNNPAHKQMFNWLFDYNRISLKLDMIMDYLFQSDNLLAEARGIKPD